MKPYILAGLGLLCAQVAVAGSEPVIVPAATLEAANPLRWEVAANANYALTDICKNTCSPSINTYGADVTSVYNVKGNHYFTCRFSYAYGEDSAYHLHNFAFMPGYRYQFKLTEKWAAFAGAQVGLGLSMLETPGMKHDQYAVSTLDDMMNIVYSIETGVRYAVCPNLDIFGSIMFSGGTSPMPSASYDTGASEEQQSVSARIGVGFKF